MIRQLFIGICTLAVALPFSSCNNEDKTDTKNEAVAGLKEENNTYTSDSVTMNGYVVYDTGTSGKRPVVLVVHEWWGQNDYPRMRAKQLAEMGYLAMAVDMYGNGKTVDNPTDATNISTPFYQNPQMTKARFDAALAKIKSHPLAGDKIAAIGYCFGGGVVVNVAKLGEDLAGVVSFHGGGLTVIPANKDLIYARMLLCHGADDKYTTMEEVNNFKKQMDSVGAQDKYEVKIYPGATHAFSNPNASEMRKRFPQLEVDYNAAADSASWKDMKEFLGRVLK